jgi:glycosyltransferase involved in cell wall biosynthesis
MHLIVFCHLRWDFVLQRPQHVLSRIAQRHPVLFVEEPVRCNEGEQRIEITTPAPGVNVLRPHTPVDAQGFAGEQTEPVGQMLAMHLRQQGITDYAVWLYTPMAMPLAQRLHPQAIVYDCMDELTAFKNAPAQLSQLEADLLKAADIVFTGGPSLYEARRDRHRNVLCLPSAVDADHFSRPRALADASGMQRAADLQARVAHPRLGFFGVVDERLDLDLLSAMADAHPDWQLVMVGPVAKISEQDLPRRGNIHWLGQQSYDLLPHLVATWDVCMLPFALNESTRFISPTKTLEYLAADRAVVSTPVRDVEVLYGQHVRIANGGKAFIDACNAALNEGPEEAARRKAGARATVGRYSWDRTAQTMLQAIAAVLRERAAPRSHAASGRMPEPQRLVALQHRDRHGAENAAVRVHPQGADRAS